MKLYEISPKSYVRVVGDPDGYYFFDHVDGMYSICLDIENQIHHLSASTEVEILQPPPTW